MHEDFYQKIQYTFQKPELLEQALTHSSFAHEQDLSQQAHNERLEFLGDAVLELSVSEILFERFPNFSEGQLTKFRANLVCEQSLAKMARQAGLEPLLKLGKGEEGTGGRHRDALLADAFEAVLGALYLDGRQENAQRFVRLFFEPEMKDLRDRFEYTDYKTFLQETLQKNGQESVTYTITQEKGPDHNKTFTAAAVHQGVRLGIGTGKSKKEAEQSAAQAAIQKLELAKA